MDSLTDNEIKEYLSGLPKPVLELLQDDVWSKRVDEIASKYSLNEEQTDTLKNLVLFVLIGAEDPDTFEESLEKEVGISSLIGKQMVDELDARVFKYAFDFIDKQGGFGQPVAAPVAAKSNFDVLEKQKEEVEIPPRILPMVESKEQREKVMAENRYVGAAPAKTAPAPANLPKAPAEPVGKIQEGTFIGADFVQKPISVPRFSAATPSAPVPEVKPQNIIDQKLSSATSAAEKKPAVEYPPRYGVDPYREPLE